MANNSKQTKQKPAKPTLSEDQIAHIADVIADKLVKRPSFQRMVAWKVILFGALIALLAIVGGKSWINGKLNQYTDGTTKEISNRLFSAKHDITNRIVSEFETVRVRELVSEVASNGARILLDAQVQPEMERFRNEVSSNLITASASINQLTNASRFSMVLLAAQMNERRAFETLKEWAEDSSFPDKEAAHRAHQSIIDTHNDRAQGMGRLVGGYLPPWGTNPDPKSPVDALLLFYRMIQPVDVRQGLIQATSARDDLLKRERLRFLVEVMKQEQDLRPLSLAGRYFAEISGFNMKTLSVEQFLKWWTEHESELGRDVVSAGK